MKPSRAMARQANALEKVQAELAEVNRRLDALCRANEAMAAAIEQKRWADDADQEVDDDDPNE